MLMLMCDMKVKSGRPLVQRSCIRQCGTGALLTETMGLNASNRWDVTMKNVLECKFTPHDTTRCVCVCVWQFVLPCFSLLVFKDKPPQKNTKKQTNMFLFFCFSKSNTVLCFWNFYKMCHNLLTLVRPLGGLFTPFGCNFSPPKKVNLNLNPIYCWNKNVAHTWLYKKLI